MSMMAAENINHIGIEAQVFPHETSAEEVAEFIIGSNAELVGFSMYIWNFSVLRKSAELTKERRPDIKILLGGPQVSPIAHDVIKANWFVDIIPYVTVPGENIFFQILKAQAGLQDFKNVNNIYFRDNRKIVMTPAADEDVDLATIPSPLLDGTIELNGTSNYQIVLESSRGCLMRCAYCFWSGESRCVRYFPMERTLAEIEKIYSDPRVTHVIFADPDILVNRERANIIVDKVMSYGNRISTFFEVDAIRITESSKEILEKIASLDRSLIKFAIQSSNPETLRIMNRRAGFSTYVKKAELVRSWIPGVELCIENMLPLPGDTLATFMNTINDSLSLEPARVHTNYPVYLLPGTAYFNERTALGITDTGEPNFTIIETETFSKKDIGAAVRLALYAELLTYYHPIIAKILYSLSRVDTSERSVDRLARWMTAIEQRLNLLGQYGDIVAKITESVDNLNVIKGNFLHSACSPSESVVIYQTILEQESRFQEATEELRVGIAVFEQIAALSSESEHSPYDNLDLIFPRGSAPGAVSGLDTILKFVPRFDFRGRIGGVGDPDENESYPLKNPVYSIKKGFPYETPLHRTL